MVLEIENSESIADIVKEVDDHAFAEEWRQRYEYLRLAMLPDNARWMRLLRFYHPRQIKDHWQDQSGRANPKLAKSRELSVEIFNWCRPIVEVYGSLLSGQKPLPFTIDVPPTDANLESEVFRADAAEKVLLEEMYNQKIPLHFADFCTSVVLFGIGYIYSWIDEKTNRLKTRAIPWPADVLPIWGSDRYGAGAEGMEACILQERLPLETAERLYPNVKFIASTPTQYDIKPEQDVDVTYGYRKSVHILKIWYRWSDGSIGDADNVHGDEHIGYAEVAYEGVQNEGNPVLYRKDDTKYPDIPIKWAARFATPGEAPHHAAGVLDDVVGINTEYNEKFCALSDAIMRQVYQKYKGRNMTDKTMPRLAPGQSIYPLGPNQDLIPLVEAIGQVPFDAFLTRLETMMLSIAGLSRLMMGSLPPGETSGEALMNLLHAAIGRLEVIRTPIQWAWVPLVADIWIPLLTEYGSWNFTDISGKKKSIDVKMLFDGIKHIDWQWPDVTPRDAMRAAELAMNLGRGGWLSDEGVMKRASIPSVVDELQKLRRQKQDKIMHPADVAATAAATLQELQVKAAEMQQQMAEMQMAMGSPMGPANTEAPNDIKAKDAAAKTPALSAEDNAVAPGTPENAAQGMMGKAPQQLR